MGGGGVPDLRAGLRGCLGRELPPILLPHQGGCGGRPRSRALAGRRPPRWQGPLPLGAPHGPAAGRKRLALGAEVTFSTVPAASGFRDFCGAGREARAGSQASALRLRPRGGVCGAWATREARRSLLPRAPLLRASVAHGRRDPTLLSSLPPPTLQLEQRPGHCLGTFFRLKGVHLRVFFGIAPQGDRVQTGRSEASPVGAGGAQG